MAVLQGPSRPIGYDTRGNPVFPTRIEQKGDKLYQSPTWFGTPPPAQYSGGQNLSGTGGVSYGGYAGSLEYTTAMRAREQAAREAQEKAKQELIKQQQAEAQRLAQEKFQAEEAARQAYQKQLNEAKSQEQRNLAIANFNRQQQNIQRQEIESRIKSGISKSYAPSSSYGNNYTLGYSSGESITPNSFSQQGTSGIPSSIIQIPGGTGIPKTTNKQVFRDTGTIITTPRKPNVPEYATKTSVMLGQERYPTLEELKQTYEWSYVKPYKTGTQYKTKDLFNVYTAIPAAAEKTANLLRKVPAIRRAEQKVQSYGLSSGGLGIANRAQGIFSSAVTTSGPFILFSPLMSAGTAGESEYVYDYRKGKFIKKAELLQVEKPSSTIEDFSGSFERAYIEKGTKGVTDLLKKLAKRISQETDPVKKAIAEKNFQSLWQDLASKNLVKDVKVDLLTGRISRLSAEPVKPSVDFLGIAPVRMEGMSYLGFGVAPSEYQGSEYGLLKTKKQLVEEQKLVPQKEVLSLLGVNKLALQMPMVNQEKLVMPTLLSVQALVQKPEVRVRQEKLVVQAMVQKQVQKQQQKQTLKQMFGFSFPGEQVPRPPKPTKTKPPIPYWDFDSRKKKEQGKAYDVFVLQSSTKKPKWLQVGNDLPLISALSVGGRIVDSTPSARFKVTEDKQAKPSGFIDKAWGSIAHKFRSFSQKGGMRIATPGVYYEKQRYRMDDPQNEQRKISQARASNFLIGSMRQPRTRRRLFRL